MVWEERWHPLRREWVVISSHRDRRPWQGETVGRCARASRRPTTRTAISVPGTRACPASGIPQYDGVFAFDNDHPCVGPDAPDPDALSGRHPITIRRADGLSRVVCYSPRHDLLAGRACRLTRSSTLLEELQRQFRELSARPEVRHVLMFENKGDVVGVSNPHPHCQIYATNFVFRTIELEAEASAAYLAENGRVLFQDIIAAEEADGRRILASNGSALVVRTVLRSLCVRDVRRASRDTRRTSATLSPDELVDLAAVPRRDAHSHGQPLANAVSVRDGAPSGAHRAASAPRDSIFTSRFTRHFGNRDCSSISPGPEIGGGNFLNDTAPEDKAASFAHVDHALPCHRRIPSGAPALRSESDEGRSRSSRSGALGVSDAGDCFRRSSRCTTAFACRCSRRSRRRTATSSPASRTTTRATRSTRVDRVSEAALVDGLAEVARDEPLVLVAEGLPAAGLTLPEGTRDADCRWRLLVDPIDGTRGLMYQKRPAWILTGVAPNKRTRNRLRDIVLAVQTEIPLLKQHLCDQLWAVRGEGVEAQRIDRLTGSITPLTLATVAVGDARARVLVRQPILSRRARCPRGDRRRDRGRGDGAGGGWQGGVLRGSVPLHGRPALRAHGRARPLHRRHPPRDRVRCSRRAASRTALLSSLRPVLEPHRRGSRRQADRCRRRSTLDAPFDLDADVSWVGYANDRLRARVEPALLGALARRGLGTHDRPDRPLAQVRVRTLEQLTADGDLAWFASALDRLRSLPHASDPSVARFLAADRAVAIARAPGRLDVMGGIADYSGSLVLEMPLACATYAVAQAQDDRRLDVLSLRERRPAVSIRDRPGRDHDGRARVRRRRSRRGSRERPDDRWAAYVVGSVYPVPNVRRASRRQHGLRLADHVRRARGKGRQLVGRARGRDDGRRPPRATGSTWTGSSSRRRVSGRRITSPARRVASWIR